MVIVFFFKKLSIIYIDISYHVILCFASRTEQTNSRMYVHKNRNVYDFSWKISISNVKLVLTCNNIILLVMR